MALIVAQNERIQNSKIEKYIGNSLDLAKDDATSQSSPIKGRKAKRIRFFANGDRFSKGVVMAVTPDRYRSFDSLLNELTRSLSNNVRLSTGVRVVFTMDGRKVSSLDELEDGALYVCSGLGETFKKVDYTSSLPRPLKSKPRSFSRLVPTVTGNNQARPQIIIVVRNGNRPRKAFRLLISKRNAPSFDHALSSITDLIKLDTGAVRKLFSSQGNQVTDLDELFKNEDLFFAYGSERTNPDDFELDPEELKLIQALTKGLRKNGELKTGTHCIDQNGRGIPKLPTKTKAAKGLKRGNSSPNIAARVLSRFNVGPVIGDGNFAVVRKCVDKTKAVEYALKIIDKSKCLGKEQMIENEVTVLRNVKHPNIIQLITEYDTPTELYLVMELVKGGDLFDAISRAVKFPEADAMVMTQNLASALAYLHERKIVHRDIKPENLLVEMDGERLKTLKVGDFGLAQLVTEPLTTICGTPTYVAPEILAETGYGLEIDVWAMGVILYITLCGFPPFVSANNDQEELFDDILSGQYGYPSPYWDDVSDIAKDLIAHMLQSNPYLRFTAEDVLDHPWFETEN